MTGLAVRTRLERPGFTLALDVELPSSGVTGILGPSGSGKTTLLRVIAGLEAQADATVRFGSTTWQDVAVPAVPPHRRGVGLVFQEASLFAHLTVRENLDYGRTRTPPAARSIPFARAVTLLGLDQLLDRSPDALSGGERQRVAIARALLAGPVLLLMDEPLANVDPQHRDEVLAYLERLPHELDIPILYVSHQRDDVTRLAGHLVLLRDGRVEGGGPIEEILTRLDLPIAQEPDAGVAIACTVESRDDRYALTTLAFGPQRLFVTGDALPNGTMVRARIAARDVSVALERPARTSVVNVLPAVVTGIGTPARGQVTITLDVSGTTLLARITEKSLRELAIEPGTSVYAQIKGVAVVR